MVVLLREKAFPAETRTMARVKPPGEASMRAISRAAASTVTRAKAPNPIAGTYMNIAAITERDLESKEDISPTQSLSSQLLPKNTLSIRQLDRMDTFFLLPFIARRR